MSLSVSSWVGPSSMWVPSRTATTAMLRPSIRWPPRLMVNCWPASIQPWVSMWYFWIDLDGASAWASEWSVLLEVAVWWTATWVGGVARTWTGLDGGTKVSFVRYRSAGKPFTPLLGKIILR